MAESVDHKGWDSEYEANDINTHGQLSNLSKSVQPVLSSYRHPGDLTRRVLLAL